MAAALTAVRRRRQVSDFAKLDGHRMDRTGLPEAVWGPGKTPVQIATILQALTKTQRTALATRIEPHVYESIRTMLPGEPCYQALRPASVPDRTC